MPRGRPSKTLKGIQKNISIPEDLCAKMELELFSEVEGRIPHGAQKEFFEKLLRKHFEQKEVDVKASIK